jgi:hypothetical protein
MGMGHFFWWHSIFENQCKFIICHFLEITMFGDSQVVCSIKSLNPIAKICEGFIL